MSAIVNCLKSFLSNRIPPQLVIQFTNHCNARCPQCGMRVHARMARSTLSDSAMRRILDAAAARNVATLSFTGGEPLLFLDRLVAWMDYAGQVGIPFIRTGTNGFLLRRNGAPGFEDRIKRLAERLAATPLRNFWISLDSAYPAVHEKMRGLAGVVAGIEKALPIFHAAGLYPSANLGINRAVAGAAARHLKPGRYGDAESYLAAFYGCYRDAFDRFYRFVRTLGFSMVNACYPMSIGEADKAGGLSAVYAATSAEDVVRFSAAEKAVLYKALLETIPEHRAHLRIFSPLSSLYMLYRQYAHPERDQDSAGCRGGIDFFFINAENGDTYPCGYRGDENLGQFHRLDLRAMKRVPDCRRCDWECFRDPSELCAPVLQALHQPLALSRKLRRDSLYRTYWMSDLRYYGACDFFDGRKPLVARKMNKFAHPRFNKILSQV